LKAKNLHVPLPDRKLVDQDVVRFMRHNSEDTYLADKDETFRESPHWNTPQGLRLQNYFNKFKDSKISDHCGTWKLGECGYKNTCTIDNVITMLADHTLHTDPDFLKHFRASHCNKNEGLFADAIEAATKNESSETHSTWGPVLRKVVDDKKSPKDLYGTSFAMTIDQLKDTVSLDYDAVCEGTATKPCRHPKKKLITKELGLRRYTTDESTGAEKQQTLDEAMNECLYGNRKTNCTSCTKGLPPGQPCPQRTEKGQGLEKFQKSKCCHCLQQLRVNVHKRRHSQSTK